VSHKSRPISTQQSNIKQFMTKKIAENNRNVE